MWFSYSQDGLSRHGIYAVKIVLNLPLASGTSPDVVSEVWGQLVSKAPIYVVIKSRNPDKTRRWIRYCYHNLSFRSIDSSGVSLSINMADVGPVVRMLNSAGAHDISHLLKEDLQRRVILDIARNRVTYIHNTMTLRSLVPSTREKQNITIEEVYLSAHELKSFGSMVLRISVGGVIKDVTLLDLSGVAKLLPNIRTIQWEKVDRLLRDRGFQTP